MMAKSVRGAGVVNIAGVLTALAVMLTGILQGGCGFKDKPVPPQEIVPVAITDLRYELDDKGVTLTWTYPARTVRGSRLTDLAEFLVYRAVVPADKYCDTCPIPFGEPVSIPGGAVAEKKAKSASYRATLLRPDHLFFFKVRSRSGWWAESDDSNIVSFMWNVPPVAPENFAAKVIDGGIALGWAPVITHLDGSAIGETVNYQVYRSTGGGPYDPIGELVASTEVTDTDVVSGREYRYQVQAVTMYPKGQVGGGMSAEVVTTPMDRTPAQPPASVQGIRTAQGVKIIWDSMPADEVTAYRVYRRLEGEAEATRIGEVKEPATLFDDQAPPVAPAWYYSVTSLDNAQPANESAPSPEVRVAR